IKTYGRATLSTASFRGTAPSHTQVTWNGMKINSPMLGMVDFSLLPSYLIDHAQLYHGASSVGVTGGGLGGAITLGSAPLQEDGMQLRFIQGTSSYRTFDEFLRLTYGNNRLKGSTRVYYATSKNDFKYNNYKKKEYTYDGEGNIVDGYYPRERNKNGSFKDFHLLQDLFYTAGDGSRFAWSGWYMNSRRGIPMLNVDYKEESQSKNQQDEETFRTTLSWDKLIRNMKLSAHAGYSYTSLQYVYLSDIGKEEPAEMIRSESDVHTGYARLHADYYVSDKWMFTGTLSGHQHFVKSMDRAIMTTDGNKAVIGYDKARLELSGFLSAKYRPHPRLGVAASLREEVYGTHFTPLIPAFFAEYTLTPKGQWVAKGSFARNYRYPSLNDLYFMPGGNDSLRTEKGYTYDLGVEYTLKKKNLEFKGELTGYDSYIKDWIVWLPTFKGFWSPKNVRKVHSYGLEIKGNLKYQPAKEWLLSVNGNYSITHSINHGDPVNWSDESIGKQLVYIPKYNAALTAMIEWKDWVFTYKWNYYSRRYTTSSNETATRLGLLSAYYMNDVSLEKRIHTRWAGVSLKFTVNNLFNEEYESVLSHPMAGINYGFFLEITPLFRK
ncbi:MAG: TonB-dependent receptor plug domain-containing protein, partial [Tannerellaceae bacterium]|nr:TonB-dependent receptor plug domain-containing protein [Tannerellaceae bacterium]